MPNFGLANFLENFMKVAQKSITNRSASRFLRDPSVDYINTLNHLNDLTPDEGERVIAEYYQPTAKNYFFESLEYAKIKFNESSRKDILKWLHFKRSTKTSFFCFPREDHTEMFTVTFENGTKQRYCIYQPYNEFDMEYLSKLITICKENYLDVSIHPNSWHFIGRTLLVVIKGPIVNI